jgi:KUP system potassium uptake protein
MSAPPKASASDPRPARWAALTALGIVYGDLGTSPLYTLQTVVQAVGGHFSAESALGILSLILWTLIITISIKYCLFVMRADNNGEGGILALMSLVGGNSFKGRAGFLAVMGLIGAGLIYGDGVITPAISVLSALEGVNVVTTSLKPFILPIAVVILALLFAAQRFGTAKIGQAFGPIMFVWFIVIALLGLSGVIRHPIVLTAIDPSHAVRFLAHSGAGGVLVLGGVFLCITGGEAMYADMGHIGRGPIRLSWYVMVLPALVLSYAGQIGLLMEKGTITGNPFFQLAPAWAVYPLVGLATIATIIASQAIITGAFSMTRQAMQLGWLPGFNIRQTSDKVYGQIYVPVVNWLMMVATVGIALAFGSSDRLAGAYGTAVSTTMLLTTGLLFVAMRRVWRWPLGACLAIAGAFLIVDLAFFGANLMKVADGGWLPLGLGAVVFVLMITWRSGVDAVRASLASRSEDPAQFIASLNADQVPRVPGAAVFLTRSEHRIPALMVDHIKHMGALHRDVVVLRVVFEEAPRVADAERSDARLLGEGIWWVTIRFGFVEIPDVCAALEQVKEIDKAIDFSQAVYFATRDLITPAKGMPWLARRRLPLFAFLYRNAAKVVDRFRLPAENVVEIARQIEI